MITTKFLKEIYTEARPIIERHLDDAELLAGLREVVAAQGGDWSSLKALITADVKDGRDEAGDGKRVKKILDKADYSAAYADMLGLANMNDGSFSAQEDFDAETGEVIEPANIVEKFGEALAADHAAGKSVMGKSVPITEEEKEQGVIAAFEDQDGIRSSLAVPSRAAHPKDDMEIPAFLRRTKPPPELVE